MVAGLTGGIGSGKSIVARVFELLGAVVFDSDSAAKAAYFDPEVKPRIIALLGPESYLSATSLNTSFISGRIFSDPALREALNAIIHPVVIQRSREFIHQNAGRLVIKESALLFEAGLEKEMDTVIVVAADEETRIQRVMARDGLSRGAVVEKLKSQLPQEEKIRRADFVIVNDESRLLLPQVVSIYQRLCPSSHV
jgi:dephospho-CoA kinase